MRQEFAELKTVISSLIAQPLRLAQIEPQFLQPAIERAVSDTLQQHYSGISHATKQSEHFTMSFRDRNCDQSPLRDSPRPSFSLTQHQRYSQSRFSDKDLVYFSSWLGSVTVTRKATASQCLDREGKELRTDDVLQTTAFQFTPAPWLTNTAYVVSLQKRLNHATSPNIGLALQPVRFRDIPMAAWDGLKHGDLALLQQMLMAGQLSLHDREVGGDHCSVFELSIRAIRSVWLFNECTSSDRIRMIDVIRTVRWIFIRGTSADTQCQDAILPSSFDFGSMRGTYSGHEIEQMEQVLVEVSENEPSVARGQRLLSFALSNPEHSLYIDCVISDIAMEDYTEQEMLSVSNIEGKHWAEGSILDGGQEAIIFHALIRLRREYRERRGKCIPKTVLRDILKGPRRVLFEMLKIAALEIHHITRVERVRLARDTVDYVSSLLRVCRDLPILEDGFGDLMSAYAYEHQIRDIWNAIMGNSTGYSDGIDPEVVRLDLDTSISLFIWRDSERRVVDFEDVQAEVKGSLDTRASSLEYLWALVVLFLRSII